MDVSIIIVNWKSVDYLRKCLASIRAETHTIAYEIIVIDSGSYDGCDRMLRESYPEVRFLQSERNVGFAKSNNLAFKASRGRNVLFLNPDTEVLGAALDTLHEQLHRLPKAGAVGCKLLNADLSIQTSCVQSLPTILNQLLDTECLRARWPNSPLWGTAALFASSDKPAEVEVISGAALMLKRSVFEEVGCFSEEYFMYAEDGDLCYKVKQAGYRNYFIPQASIIHHGGRSSGQAPSQYSAIMMRESTWRFLTKTRGRFYALVYRCSMGGLAICRLMLLALMLFARCLTRARCSPQSAPLGKWLATLRWSFSLKTPGRDKFEQSPTC